MSAVGSVDTFGTQATQAALAGTAATATQTQSPASGLPPASLAAAASANTLNAELATSQWGVDPNSVGGVYGGSGGSTDPGGIFSGTSLLPLLTNLTHANAEQALALIGVNTPKPGGTAGGSSSSTAAHPQSQSSLAQAAYSGSTPMVVDPLWGRSA